MKVKSSVVDILEQSLYIVNAQKNNIIHVVIINMDQKL